MAASCQGERFGHNFPYTGACCLDCGISQDTLSGKYNDKTRSIEPMLRPENKKMHSPAHLLADEIIHSFSEPKRFAMYLGVINRIGVIRSRQIFQELQASHHTITSKRKLFMWHAKEEFKRMHDNTSRGKK